LLCPGGGDPDPARIWCEDFEDVNLAEDYPADYYDDDGDFVDVANEGVDGSRALRTIFQQGEDNGGKLLFLFGLIPDGVGSASQVDTETKFTEMYYRFYMRTGDGFGIGDYGVYKSSRMFGFSSESDWSQSHIAHLWTESDESFLKADPVNCRDHAGGVCEGYNDFAHMIWLGGADTSTPIFSPAYNDIWICIEHHVKLNDSGQSNGVEEVWIDGVREVYTTGLDFVGTYTDYAINALYLESYWNGGAPGTLTLYRDNLVVSTDPIGCNTIEGPTPTASPTATPTDVPPTPTPTPTADPSEPTGVLGYNWRMFR
jgi:hypothetical protein